MTLGTSKTDNEAYELATRTANAQRAKLHDWQRAQISDRDMQTGETWFLWGFYSAMTSDIEGRKNLLLAHLNNQYGASENNEHQVAEIAKLADQENRLFDVIAAAGRQAYHEGGDSHLANIASIFLNVIRNH
ncbi:hypothetical protein [Phyllobacterium sp. YR531]|uniref:hypothetical protein n=1 Tax=Phyllobacterium sp. YR531 TaxID=1144343 RepID=UPI00026F9009|nr:hypothetical protein [Phyllobacterium sp. YR531]EJN02168.1 hypothetical protein PMI41_02919 [Phyllobacterium sp. YR531]